MGLTRGVPIEEEQLSQLVPTEMQLSILQLVDDTCTKCLFRSLSLENLLFDSPGGYEAIDKAYRRIC
jgi:hypothetical protein